MTRFKGAIYEAPKRGFPMLAVTIVNGVVEARPVRSRSEGMDAIEEARWIDERRRELEAHYAPRPRRTGADISERD